MRGLVLAWPWRMLTLPWMMASIDSHINDTSLALAGQAGGGIRFAFSDNITLDAGYRFKGALAVLTKGDVSDDSYHGSASYYSHVGQIGLTWGF